MLCIEPRSFIEDTPDLLRLFEEINCKNPLPANSFPVTVDVVSLYTSIPAEGSCGGLEALENSLESRVDKTVPTEFLIKLAKKVLHGNIFEFDEEFYIQKIGTAMGTKMAPSYAIIFMAELEKKMLSSWRGTPPLFFRRFIDDILFFWTGTIDELDNFLSHINNQHTHIKFTAEFNATTKQVPFLDTMVSVNEGVISTDLYKKPTAVAQYLLPSSCHPGHITKNIPYSLAYRLRRICSTDQLFEERLLELKNDLLNRNYHHKIIDQAFERARQV